MAAGTACATSVPAATARHDAHGLCLSELMAIVVCISHSCERRNFPRFDTTALGGFSRLDPRGYKTAQGHRVAWLTGNNLINSAGQTAVTGELEPFK